MSPRLPNIQSVQDMPPPGGYPKFDTTSKLRPRGPSGFMIWGMVFAATAYGFYNIGLHNRKARYEHKEKREIRMAMIPFLQAETDRKFSAQIKEDLEKEAEIMKDVEGWEVGKSTYSKRWNYPIKQ